MNVIQATCRSCNGERKCAIHADHEERGGDDDYSWHRKWQILECQGCGYTFARTISTNSEDYHNFYEADGSTGTEYVETFEHWPPLSVRTRPEWMFDYGIDAVDVEEIDRVLVELYSALDQGLPVLAAIGIRTAFDVAATTLGADSELPLAAKLDALVARQHIRLAERDSLAILIEGGNASAHRGWRPTSSELDTLMNILEHFVANAFILPQRKKAADEKASKLRSTIPARKRTASGDTSS